MPNPDGTHTEDEHREAILGLASRYVAQGMGADEAIEKAGAAWREHIRAEAAKKIAAVEKFLGIRKH